MAILEKSLLVLWVMVLIVTEAKHHTRSRQEVSWMFFLISSLIATYRVVESY